MLQATRLSITLIVIATLLLGGCSSVKTTPTPTNLPPEPGEEQQVETPTGAATPRAKTPADYLSETQAREVRELDISPETYSQEFRPQFHFSPAKGWIGDPDGTVHFQGKYHLFWWGHAESPDLVHWKERPFPQVNLPGLDSGSGGVVIDLNNDSGLAIPGQNPPMLAFFTIFDVGNGHQAPGLAVSYDYTRFAYYEGNPLIVHEERDFRDPHVFYYAPAKRWIMAIAIAAKRQIGFYGSTDLKHWEHLSDFGPVGPKSQVWECPDLFQLPVDGDTNNMKWVMLVGMGPNKEMYFVGDFDGTQFTLDSQASGYLLRGEGMNGEVFADFEKGIPEGWAVEGDGAGTVTDGDAPYATGSLGTGYLSTFTPDSLNGNVGQVTVASPDFTVQHNVINFLVSGGNHAEETYISLWVDGKVVLQATGDNSSQMRWVSWDVSTFKGQTAKLQIVDKYSGADAGHINVDHILFSDTATAPGLEHGNWMDWGPDYYATRTVVDWDKQQSRVVAMSWLGNWEYAQVVPTSWGRGVSALPRELNLQSYTGGLRLVHTPIPELQTLRQEPVILSGRTVAGQQPLTEFQPRRNTYELEATFRVTGPDSKFGVRLGIDDRGYSGLQVGYDARTSTVFIDRTKLENSSFRSSFPKYVVSPLEVTDGTVKLHIFVDQSSVEVFANDGQATLSALMLPARRSTGIELFADRGEAELLQLTAWQLTSIWGVPEP